MDSIQAKPFQIIDANQPVHDAMKVMGEKNIASVIVTENDRLVGIFSERDVLNKVAENYEKMKDQPVREVMTPNPVAVYEIDSPAKAMNQMAIGGFRHVPILDLDDKVVGVLGPRRVTAYVTKHVMG